MSSSYGRACVSGNPTTKDKVAIRHTKNSRGTAALMFPNTIMSSSPRRSALI